MRIALYNAANTVYYRYDNIGKRKPLPCIGRGYVPRGGAGRAFFEYIEGA